MPETEYCLRADDQRYIIKKSNDLFYLHLLVMFPYPPRMIYSVHRKPSLNLLGIGNVESNVSASISVPVFAGFLISSRTRRFWKIFFPHHRKM
ncbi:hypothetical protein HMPREF1326_02262 [Akkermansia sp. KLE1605]|nr:hypothetical protein HMPREF1326_02262 [Akkermansia sp. KLE1605]